jgi:RNase H-like domain found in reverse transcriptase
VSFLAVYSGILHFRHLLEGRPFVIFTDHKPLVGALSRAAEPRSDRQWRQLSFIAEFTAEIYHITGPDNVVADALSFPAATAAAPTYGEIVAGTATVLPGSGPQAGLTHRVATAGLHLHSPGSGPQAGLTPMVTAAGLHPHSSAGSAPVVAAAATGGSNPPPPPASAPPVDIRDLAAAQSSCPDCARAARGVGQFEWPASDGGPVIRGNAAVGSGRLSPRHF